jgi:hypothetical protein
VNANTSTVRHSLLTVHFSISAWEGRKQDKRASKEVATTHGTDSNVGRYHKDLLPGAVEHDEILKLRNAWRVEHYENTLPWGDEGSRVMRSASFLDYAAMYRTREGHWTRLLNKFEAAYPTLVAQAELRLNTLFDPKDYPPVDQVMQRFSVRLNTYPLPDVEDFRIIEGIPPEEADRLVAEAVEGINTRLNEAVKDLWARMHVVVTNMQERLAVPIGAKGGKFHDTLVGNVQDLLDVLPKLNLTNDPAIAQMAADMTHLVQFPAETLRQSPDARETTGLKAAALAKRMAQYV